MRPDEPLPTSLIEEFAINLDGMELQTIPGRKQQRVVPSLEDATQLPLPLKMPLLVWQS